MYNLTIDLPSLATVGHHRQKLTGIQTIKKTSQSKIATILEAVDSQLRDLNPPETKETYDRLRASGVADQEARRLSVLEWIEFDRKNAERRESIRR